jgi:hypothetical protein
MSKPANATKQEPTNSSGEAKTTVMMPYAMNGRLQMNVAIAATNIPEPTQISWVVDPDTSSGAPAMTTTIALG